MKKKFSLSYKYNCMKNLVKPVFFNIAKEKYTKGRIKKIFQYAYSPIYIRAVYLYECMPSLDGSIRSFVQQSILILQVRESLEASHCRLFHQVLRIQKVFGQFLASFFQVNFFPIAVLLIKFHAYGNKICLLFEQNRILLFLELFDCFGNNLEVVKIQINRKIVSPIYFFFFYFCIFLAHHGIILYHHFVSILCSSRF